MCKINWGGWDGQRKFLQEEWGGEDRHATGIGRTKKSNACNRNGGREAGLCAPRLSSRPSPETDPDPCPLLPQNHLWHQRVPTPVLTRVGHPDTWVPCSRYGEEREEKPGQQVKFQNIL